MEANQITDALDKVIRIEDQVLIGAGRVSRAVTLGNRIITALQAELTGEDEQAILGKLAIVGSKAQEIVGVRPS